MAILTVASAETNVLPRVSFVDVHLEPFPVSTLPHAQRDFDQGITYLWSYNHKGADQYFRFALQSDPSCYLCAWAIALSNGPTINLASVSPAQYNTSVQMIRHAQSILVNQTSVEQVHVHLIEALHRRLPRTPPNDINRQLINERYATDLGEIHQSNPASETIQLLYVEALMITSSWRYWEEDGKLPTEIVAKTLTPLRQLLQRNPRHPAAMHLYIHLMESSSHPKQAEEVADRLATIGDWPPHLLHMPSHIYARIGRYDDAVNANFMASRLPHQVYECHNLDFLQYALQIQGRSGLALEIASSLQADSLSKRILLETDRAMERFSTQYLYALVRFQKWQRILWVQRPPRILLFHTAVWHFARGVAKAQLQLPNDELEALVECARHVELKNGNYGVLQVEEVLQVLILTLRSHLVAVSGEYGRAAQWLEQAIETEGRIRYDEPPQVVLSLRQQLGEMLLLNRSYARARVAYEQDLERMQDNGWALKGLEQACEKLRDWKCQEDAALRFNDAWKQADVILTSSVTVTSALEDLDAVSASNWHFASTICIIYIFGMVTGLLASRCNRKVRTRQKRRHSMQPVQPPSLRERRNYTSVAMA